MNKEEIINVLKEYMTEIPNYANVSFAIGSELIAHDVYIEGDMTFQLSSTNISFPLVSIIQ